MIYRDGAGSGTKRTNLMSSMGVVGVSAVFLEPAATEGTAPNPVYLVEVVEEYRRNKRTAPLRRRWCRHSDGDLISRVGRSFSWWLICPPRDKGRFGQQ